VTRRSLSELRRIILRNLDHRWVTPSQVADALDTGHGDGWLRVALTLERLANDGLAEIRIRGKNRYYRRAGG
jgi:DNA-binding transcriptional ArsR family regulator